MIKPLRPFAEIASDLYLPKSFEAPPPQVSLPGGQGEWLYYESGDGPTAQTFEAFMASARFGQVRDQIQGRIESCMAFADQHFSPTDAAGIRSGFGRFLRHLTERDGLGYFDKSQLQLLFSFGKRCLDDFCLLLNHPSVDVHQRKNAVRELADQIGRCRGAGPALMEAMNALQQPEGTLRGAYWNALKSVLDASLQHYVQKSTRNDSEAWRASMEVHLVNRHRLNLSLPGADPTDRFSLGSVVSDADSLLCARTQLMKDGRPAAVALLLAAQYRERLTELAAAELSPAEASTIDPAQPHHMDALVRAHRRLQHTFSCTPLNSLLEEDRDTDDFRWRNDDSLVARDILLELAREAFIRPPIESVVSRGSTAEGDWSFRHLDHRIPYVQEELPLGGKTATTFSGVRLPHLQQLMASPSWSSKSLHEAVLGAVLKNEERDTLLDLPAACLHKANHVSMLLQRLGPEKSNQWAAHQVLDDRGLGLLLPEATAASHAALLEHLLARLASRPPAEVLALAGDQLLSRAVGKESFDVLRIWVDWIASASSAAGATTGAVNTVGAMPEALLLSCLMAPSDQTCIAKTMLRGNAASMEMLLQLVFQLVSEGRLSRRSAYLALQMPMQKVMSTPPPGVMACLAVLATYLKTAARQGWVGPQDLQSLLEGPTSGAGCVGAIYNGHLDVMDWFHTTTFELANERLLLPYQAGRLVSGLTHARRAPAGLAIANKQLAALCAHLKAVSTAAQCGYISTHQLDRLVGFRDAPRMFIPLMMLASDGQYLQAWVDTVVDLHQTGLLSSEQVMNFLTSADPMASPPRKGIGLPAMLVLSTAKFSDWTLLPIHQQLLRWVSTVARLEWDGLLSHDRTLELLTGAYSGKPALFMALRPPGMPGAAAAVLEQFLIARNDGLIDDAELRALLEGRVQDERLGDLNAFSRADPELLGQVMEGMVTAVERGRLPQETCSHLISLAAVSHFAKVDQQEDFKARYLRQLAIAALPASSV